MRKAAEFYRNNLLFTLVREANYFNWFFYFLRKFDLENLSLDYFDNLLHFDDFVNWVMI